MILNLIGRDTVKTELGLTTSTYDSHIDAMIPRVSADVRRILNCQYDEIAYATFNTSGATISLPGESGYVPPERLSKMPLYEMGQVLYNPNLPDDTYITGYNPNTDIYTISNTPTDEGDYVYPTVNIAMWSAMSKMIFWRIGNLSTDTPTSGIVSKSIGTISISYSEKEINKRWNYPQPIIDDLGVPFSRVG